MAITDTDYPATAHFETGGGIAVTRRVEPLAWGGEAEGALSALVDELDHRRGMLMACGVEAPGRYSPHEIGFARPPLAVTARGRMVRIEPLNTRGRVLVPAFLRALDGAEGLAVAREGAGIGVTVAEPGEVLAEEERTRRLSVFTVLRRLAAALATDADRQLGLYGAFGYDLAFQFDPIDARLPRPADQRDLVLYLPDEILVVDRRTRRACRLRYDFAFAGASTEGVPRDGGQDSYLLAGDVAAAGCDHAPGAYEAVVERARRAFARGDLFEAVPGQVMREPCADSPGRVFRRLAAANPAPFGALVNLGEGEFLVSASPEMFVRSDGRRVETCPISGTIRRAGDAIGDEARIRELLNSEKDAAELTMCTDVDRNDKARVCVPGSVRVIGRRRIEVYSRLIHTVDHVEGRLRAGYDALDAFLTHAWAVTVTGAPKRRAMQFIEDNERSARRWYGGAFGALLADGGIETGLTLRTIRMKEGVAEVRAGATLLIDSDPAAEDTECRLKAEALFAAIRGGRGEGTVATASLAAPAAPARPGAGRRVLLVDCEDSFVHSLADCFRQTGAEVCVVRHGLAPRALERMGPDLVVLSPGPGRPADFAAPALVGAVLARGLPLFGVCLGLQAVVEFFGGGLDVGEAVHGRASEIRVLGGRLFEGLPDRLSVGRYHSLHARSEDLPACLEVGARTGNGLIMAVEHRSLPVAAVQFHPESILTFGVGPRLVANAVGMLVPAGRAAA